jgi:cell division protein ZapA (FtsZ GTPase activity inhibitor)
MKYYKKFEIKIYRPNGIIVKNLIRRPTTGTVFTEDDINSQMHQIADELEKYFPQLEYKLIVLKASKYVKAVSFICTEKLKEQEIAVDLQQDGESQISREEKGT